MPTKSTRAKKFPKGRDYVGDLSYLPIFKRGDKWQDLLDETRDLGARSGHYQSGKTRFFCARTASEDKTFYDDDGTSYLVDSGFIGCYPVHKNTKKIRGGRIFDFKEPFSCSVDHASGIIDIGGIIIDTGYTEEDVWYDDYEDDDYEDEDEDEDDEYEEEDYYDDDEDDDDEDDDDEDDEDDDEGHGGFYYR